MKELAKEAVRRVSLRNGSRMCFGAEVNVLCFVTEVDRNWGQKAT